MFMFWGSKRKKMEQRLKADWDKPLAPSALDGDALKDVAQYFREKHSALPEKNIVDDITWNDLDMDAVFLHLNRTQSNVGDEVLYSMLRNTGISDETLRQRARWMEALAQNEKGRLALQRRFRKIGKDRYHFVYAFLFHSDAKIPVHARIYDVLALAPFLFLILGFFSPILFAGLAVSFFINLIIFFRTSTHWMAEQSAIRHLASVLRAARKLEKIELPGMEDAGHELRSLCAHLKPIAVWNSMFAMQPKNEIDFLTDYFRIAFLLDMVCLTRIASFVRQNQALVVRLYELMGELDACVAIASVRASLPGYSLPDFHSESAVEAAQLAHPLLQNPVKNSISWDQNALITGSNASGKSTFVKALALNAIFAQTIFTCWAERFVIPRAQVMSSMALRDDVQGGDSYFIVEIKSLRRILAALAPETPTLCFIDEILRGTNTVERIATSTSLLRTLNQQNALCMAATHDIELTQLLKDSYRQYHFREEMTEQGMTFSYLLMDGPCTTRNAIRLLEQMDFPEELTEGAKAMAKGFDDTGKWSAS